MGGKFTLKKDNFMEGKGMSCCTYEMHQGPNIPHGNGPIVSDFGPSDPTRLDLLVLVFIF